MRNILFLVIMLCSGSTLITKAQSLQQPATIKLTNASLMHEMRATPSPLDNAIVGDRKISFQWPLQDSYNILETFDATEEDENVIQKKASKENLRYKLRYSQDRAFKQGTVMVETRWPFHNPDKDLKPGVWYWQFGYVVAGKTKWATVQKLTVANDSDKYCPPSYKEFIAKLPTVHPRVYMDKKSGAT